MQKFRESQLGELIYNSNPQMLLAGALLYALGAGVVGYRGGLINWQDYILGQICVIMLQLSSLYLKVFYDRNLKFPQPSRNPSTSSQGETRFVGRNAYLFLAVTALSIGAMTTVLLIARQVLTPSVWMVLGLAFLFAFFYGTPPLRLVYSGYGELVAAVFFTNLLPGLAFLIQSDEFIQVLGMLTFPLTALFLAMCLALSLETYYTDIKEGRQNLMNRLGWQRGMFLHNLLIVFAFLLIGVGHLLKMPWSLTWPGLLPIPVGVFQIWQIWQITNGAKPRWRLLRVTAVATFSITLYLLVFTLWVR